MQERGCTKEIDLWINQQTNKQTNTLCEITISLLGKTNASDFSPPWR